MQAQNTTSSNTVSLISGDTSNVVSVIKGKTVVSGAKIQDKKSNKHFQVRSENVQAFDFVGIAG